MGKYVAVQSVTWNAGYDIRVDTKKKDKLVALTYKAGITQDTGEVRIASSYHAVPHYIYLGLERCSPHPRNCYSYIWFRGTCFDTMEYLL